MCQFLSSPDLAKMYGSYFRECRCQDTLSYCSICLSLNVIIMLSWYSAFSIINCLLFIDSSFHKHEENHFDRMWGICFNFEQNSSVESVFDRSNMSHMWSWGDRLNSCFVKSKHLLCLLWQSTWGLMDSKCTLLLIGFNEHDKKTLCAALAHSSIPTDQWPI